MAEYGFVSKLCEGIEQWSLRPTLPKEGGPPKYVALMQACWAQEPSARPSMFQVLHCVAELLADEEQARPSAGPRLCQLAEWGRVVGCCGPVCVSGALLYVYYQPSRHVLALDVRTAAFVRCFRTPELDSHRTVRLVPTRPGHCCAAAMGSNLLYLLNEDAPLFGATGVCEPQLLRSPDMAAICALCSADHGDTLWVVGAYSDDDGQPAYSCVAFDTVSRSAARLWVDSLSLSAASPDRARR